MRGRLTHEEYTALTEFAALGISVEEFLCRMDAKIKVGQLRPDHREMVVAAMPDVSVKITREDIRRVIQCYVDGKISGQELSNWAGLILAISAYELPSEESDDDLLALLNDVALPLRDDYLDREALQRRLS
jgi:hypothetical protein